jgi:7,8-dihydroneopterin aldolase/epimerase/oxygenase
VVRETNKEVDVEADLILLEGMVFHGYHGVRPDEQSLGQRFVVDIAMECDLRDAARTDDLAHTINYSEVHTQVKEIVQGPPINLIESLAERIALAILARHHRAKAVRVKVSKPQVRLGDTVLAGAAVELYRRRR